MTQPASTVQTLRAALQGHVTPAAPSPTATPATSISDGTMLAPVLAVDSSTPVPVPDPVILPPPSAAPSPQLPVVPENNDSAATPVLQPEAPTSDQPLTEAPAQATTATSSEKSPLEVLEEILAGAEAEKNAKEQEEAKKLQEEEAAKAELAAKEAAFAQEAEVRLAQQHQAIQEAGQQREQVEATLLQQGKLEPAKSNTADPFVIRQLEHEQS